MPPVGRQQTGPCQGKRSWGRLPVQDSEFMHSTVSSSLKSFGSQSRRTLQVPQYALRALFLDTLNLSTVSECSQIRSLLSTKLYKAQFSHSLLTASRTKKSRSEDKHLVTH